MIHTVLSGKQTGTDLIAVNKIELKGKCDQSRFCFLSCSLRFLFLRPFCRMFIFARQYGNCVKLSVLI